MKYMQYGGDYEIEHKGQLLRRAGRMGRHLLWPAVGAFAITVVATAARLLGPLVVSNGIDDGIAAGDTAAITRESLIYLGLLIVQYFAQRWSQFAVATVGERFLLELRSRVFEKLTRLDMPFFGRTKAGVLVSRMTSDIESITEFVNEGAVLALTNILTAVGVSVAMLLLDLQLGLAALAVIGVLVIISYQNRLRHPACFQPEIGHDDLRGVVAGQAGDVAAGMAAGATEIEVGQVRAIMAGARERSVIAHLAVGERAHQQVALPHVRKAAFHVQGGSGER
jgi:ABC-type multidrug transport system fused ATPase/permease subunit